MNGIRNSLVFSLHTDIQEAIAYYADIVLTSQFYSATHLVKPQNI